MWVVAFVLRLNKSMYRASKAEKQTLAVCQSDKKMKDN